jgi:hypothetical protein
MANVVYKRSFWDWIEGLVTMAWVLEDREAETCPLGILDTGWENSSNTWWAILKIRVSKPTLNPNPTPCKSDRNQHKMGTYNPYPRFVRVNNKEWGQKE